MRVCNSISATLFCVVAIAICSASLGYAQTYTPEQLHKHFHNEAKSYVMKSGDTTFKLRETPLMHWQNPERNQEQGTTYVWEKDGLPQATVSLFTFVYNDEVRCRHELISFSDKGFDCELHGEKVWTPKKPGVQWKPLPDVAPPAASASRRLFQMRTLAREFSGTLIHQTNGPSKLAMLPQPLLRYQSPKKNVLDGAIFSFAVATDPELLLVIEAVKDESGKTEFRFSSRPSNYHRLELKRKDAIVFEHPLVIELELSGAAQRPWCDEPFYVFTPSQPLPDPGSIK